MRTLEKQNNIMKLCFFIIFILGSIKATYSSAKPIPIENNIEKLNKLLKILNISTHLEGDIDPDDKLSLTTKVIDHVNGETFYIKPDLQGIDGKFSYSNNFSQVNSNDQYSLAGQAKTQLENDHNLSIHVQNFDTHHEEKNKALYEQYSKYLKKYIDYLYSNNIKLDPSELKDLKEQYVYYGSISNGTAPAVEAGFEISNFKKDSIVSKKYSTLGGTQDDLETSVSYGIGNFPGLGDAHSIQSAIASSSGDAPISGMQLGAREIPGAIESGALGQAITQIGKGVSMTIVDATGVVDDEGITNNASFSQEEDGTLATIGETTNRSVDDSELGRRLFPSYIKGDHDIEPVTMEGLLHGTLGDKEVANGSSEMEAQNRNSEGNFFK